MLPDFEAAAESPEAFRKLRLTPAWTPLRPHRMQQLYFWHPAPIKVCPSGRRSGKTALLKRKAVLQLIKKRPWPAKVLIGAPTHDQARTIYWDEIKALIPGGWVEKVNESRMEIRTTWGAILRVMGMNVPARAEGTPWDWMGLDELANMVPGLLDRHLLPALATVGRSVSCDLIGVPDSVGPNQPEYERYWERGLLWPKYPEICSFWWPSTDIIEPEKMAAFRSSMDPLEYEQEFGGRFVSPGGKAVPRFDVATHVRPGYCEYEPYLPLDWSLDFGVDPAASLVCQTYKGRSWVLDEIVIPNGSTAVASREFIDRARRNGWSLRRVRVFGDAAGNSRHSPTGESDYDMLRQELKGVNVEWNESTANPPVKDTVNAVRAKIINCDNQVRLHVHPRCKHLIEDLKTAPWPDDLRKFHTLAALRYYLHTLQETSGGGLSTAGLSLPALGG